MKPDPMHTLLANADQLLAACRDLGKLAARHDIPPSEWHDVRVENLLADLGELTAGELARVVERCKSLLNPPAPEAGNDDGVAF